MIVRLESMVKIKEIGVYQGTTLDTQRRWCLLCCQERQKRVIEDLIWRRQHLPNRLAQSLNRLHSAIQDAGCSAGMADTCLDG